MVKLVAVHGLAKETGTVALCKWETVYFDPLCDVLSYGLSVLVHEHYHAKKHHSLKGLLVLILLPFLYPFWRRYAEAKADAEVIRQRGFDEYRAMVYGLPHTPSRAHGATREERIRRACRVRG